MDPRASTRYQENTKGGSSSWGFPVKHLVDGFACFFGWQDAFFENLIILYYIHGIKLYQLLYQLLWFCFYMFQGFELKFYWCFGFVLCKSVILLWKTMTLWFISIPDFQNMTTLVNPVGKIEKPLLDATTYPVFGVCIDFSFGINLGIWWRQSPIHMLHLKPAHHMSLLKRQTSFPNWERLDMSTTCFSILFFHQKITTTRSGATHRKDASDELFGFVLDEERWGFCLGSGFWWCR